MALEIMFVMGYKTFVKNGTQKKVLALGIEMRLIKSKSIDLRQNFLTLRYLYFIKVWIFMFNTV